MFFFEYSPHVNWFTIMYFKDGYNEETQAIYLEDAFLEHCTTGSLSRALINLDKLYEEVKKDNATDVSSVEKTTDELFEEIEYEKVAVNEKYIIYEKYLNGYANRAQICFDKVHHTVEGIELDEDYECNMPLTFSVEELHLIARKIVELKWI